MSKNIKVTVEEGTIKVASAAAHFSEKIGILYIDLLSEKYPEVLYTSSISDGPMKIALGASENTAGANKAGKPTIVKVHGLSDDWTIIGADTERYACIVTFMHKDIKLDTCFSASEHDS